MNGGKAWGRVKRFVYPQYLVEPPYVEGTLSGVLYHFSFNKASLVPPGTHFVVNLNRLKTLSMLSFSAKANSLS
jgi:hypothetical protein